MNLLGIPIATIEHAVALELQEEHLVAEAIDGKPYLFLTPLHRAEVGVASHLFRLLHDDLPWGPIVEALRKYDGVVLFHINPMMLARYRQAFTPSQAKDDPTDAELQLELLLRHRDKLKPLAPQSPEMRALAQLVEHRRRLVVDRVRITNRLTSTLKSYFPQVLQWLPNKETKLFCDFLSQWPTLKAVQLARRSTLALLSSTSRSR